jgi:hypothetical protein
MKPTKMALAFALAAALLVPVTGRAATSSAAQCVSVDTPFVAPPPGFRPETASDADLRCYGFPPRPTDPTTLAMWTTAMQAFKEMVGPPVWVATNIHHNVVRTVTSNWAGYDAKQSDNTSIKNFYETTGQWNIPTAYSTPAGDWVSPWVGLGGVSSSNLVQAGQDSTPGGPATYKIWWEDAPAGANYCSYQCPSISPGNSFYVSVLDNQNGTATFFWENYSNGQSTSETHSTPNVDDSSSDVVIEYATSSWNFGTVNFSNATSTYNNQNNSTGISYLGNLNIEKDVISKGACPGAISGASFSVTASGSC